MTNDGFAYSRFSGDENSEPRFFVREKSRRTQLRFPGLRTLEWFCVGRAFFLSGIKIYVTWGVDYETSFECLHTWDTLSVVFLKYINGVINRDKMVCILKMIENNTKRLNKDGPEYKILQTCILEGKRFALSFVALLILLMTAYFVVVTTLIANDVFTKNATEEKYLMYQGDYYFFDAQEHYYFTTMHSYITTVVVLKIAIALDVMYMIFVQHACALLSVVGYRFRTAHVLDADALRSNGNLERYKSIRLSRQEQARMYERIKICVEEHQKVLEYIKVLQSMYSTTMFFQIILSIKSISISGVLLVLNMTNRMEVFRLGSWLIAQIFHLFFLCLPGQRLINYGEQLYNEVLDCAWYLMQKKSRVLYQFAILKTMAPASLTALKMATLNLETFLSVIQAAVSYFTFLSSTL